MGFYEKGGLSGSESICFSIMPSGYSRLRVLLPGLFDGVQGWSSEQRFACGFRFHFPSGLSSVRQRGLLFVFAFFLPPPMDMGETA